MCNSLTPNIHLPIVTSVRHIQRVPLFSDLGGLTWDRSGNIEIYISDCEKSCNYKIGLGNTHPELPLLLLPSLRRYPECLEPITIDCMDRICVNQSQTSAFSLVTVGSGWEC
jgi:hypothetical protein